MVDVYFLDWPRFPGLNLGPGVAVDFCARIVSIANRQRESTYAIGDLWCYVSYDALIRKTPIVNEQIAAGHWGAIGPYNFNVDGG